jgi:hypothetical protein
MGGKAVNPIHRPRATPQKHYFSASCTHFYERLSKPQVPERPKGLGKVGKKIHSPHRVTNPRPIGLQHSALTTKLPRAEIRNTS